MKLKNIIIKKYLCCLSLTSTTRLIALVGLAVATILASVLVHDNRRNNYYTSRKTALALGLDWQHLHPAANATYHADPEGKLISMIVIFYSVSYLVTSLTLLISTVLLNRWLTIPWLLVEICGYFSKVAALIVHGLKTKERCSTVFLVGSILYILIMTWWWVIVFATQHSWHKHSSNYSVPTTILAMSTVRENPAKTDGNIPPKPPVLVQQRSALDSPLPYQPNGYYTII